jgi:hypothetical protein
MTTDVSRTQAALKTSSEVMAEIKTDSARAFEAVAALQENTVSGPRLMMQKMVDDLNKQLRNFTISSVQDVQTTITTIDEKISELFTMKVSHQQVADSINSALSKTTIMKEIEIIRTGLNSLSDQVSVASKKIENSELENESLKKLQKSVSKLKQLVDEKLDKTTFEDSRASSGDKEKDEITAYMVSTGLHKCMSCNRPLPCETVQRGSKSHVIPGVDSAASDAFPHIHFAENVDLLRETAVASPLSRNRYHEVCHSKTQAEILHAKMTISLAEKGIIPKHMLSSPSTYSILPSKQLPPPHSPVNLMPGKHDLSTMLSGQPDFGIDRTFKGIVPVSRYVHVDL